MLRVTTHAEPTGTEGRSPWERLLFWLMPPIAIGLAVIVVRGVWLARGFPLVHDAAIMRYVVWMISRGHAPYTWMLEMNPPGTLMTEWFAAHVFGEGPAGLWRWDTSLGLVAAGAAAWISGRGYRVAGVAGALLAWLLHLDDGAANFGQRDWFLAATLLLAATCAAAAVRHRAEAWMAPAICLTAWASAVKPYAALFAVALTAIALLNAPGRRERWKTAGYSVAGGTLPCIAVALYFHHWPGAFAAFFETERTVGAWYASIGIHSVAELLLHALYFPVFLFLALTAFLWVRERAWSGGADLFLPAGFLCALAMFLLQRKGFVYQTYPLDLFGLVGGFVVAQRSLPQARDQRLAAVALLMLGAWVLPLHYVHRQTRHGFPYATQQQLTADLQRLGGAGLSRHVQCLDMTLGGCIGALNELHMEQSTGFVNDHMLFPAVQKPFLAALQQRFLREVAADPPRIVVLSDHNWPREDDHSFSKLGRWPQFADWLGQHYHLQSTYIAPAGPYTADYRIYRLN